MVHVINRLIGGGAEVMVPLIHRCHLSDGIDSWIVSMETPDDRDTDRVVAFGEKVPRWKELFLLRDILRKMDQEAPINLIHTHLTQSQLFAKWAARGLSKRPLLVTTEHDTHNRRRNLPFGKVFDRFLYSGYDQIFCISEGVQESMEEWIPDLSQKLVTVPNGVELEPLLDIERDGNGQNPVRFLSMGRLIEKKNFDTTIRALASLAQLDWEYTIVGEGEELDSWKSLASELRVENRVTFVGYTKDTVPYYRANDVFLLPSLWEGFGLVAAEAMGAGMPVLASDVPGLAEVVGKDGKAGQLLPPGKVDVWAAAIRHLIENPADRRRIGMFGRERSKDYSVAETAKGYRRHYDHLLKGEL